ncbi:MAG: ribosomal-processing cysteine protease Prp [Oscillospiraceae bacterium]|jgi:uncharacterized protein YsxB (DUF464 family)|nr:ribosomal-processing cysteine protease Prp [Oscillospiraceae bacterium]
MITAEFRLKGKRFIGFTVSGHATRIVCASVTSAVNFVANAVSDIAAVKLKVGRGGTVGLSLAEDSDNGSFLIAQLASHLKLTAENSGGEVHVKYTQIK